MAGRPTETPPPYPGPFRPSSLFAQVEISRPSDVGKVCSRKKETRIPRGHDDNTEGSIMAVRPCHCDEDDRILCVVDIPIY